MRQDSMVRFATDQPELPLNVHYAGWERCRPGHRYGRRRDHYLLHYVQGGRGVVRTDQGRTTVGPGAAFLFVPGQEHWYRADDADPWWYHWVGFSGPPPGELARWTGLTELPVVFRVARTAEAKLLIDHLFRLLDAGSAAIALELTGLALQLLHVIVEAQQHRGKQLNLVDATRAFVHRNFAEPIRVQDIASALNTHRSHLSRVFSAATGETIKDYLTRVRMEETDRLLTGTQKPVGQIGALVGYPEYQSFVAQFRRWFGTTPTEHRREL